jgi:NAD-dependent deacetylase
LFGPKREAGIVVLTGAGISVESGLEAFSGDRGLWARRPVAEVATPEGFAQDPEGAWAFYAELKAAADAAQPNAAHLALARLQRDWPGPVTLLTQNVDDLHERAGSLGVIHLHGDLQTVRCLACGAAFPWAQGFTGDGGCPGCGRGLRPNVVWYGERPLGMDAAVEALRHCRTFVAIGTSGRVPPASKFVDAVQDWARTVEINVEDTPNTPLFDRKVRGVASVAVEAWVRSLVG